MARLFLRNVASVTCLKKKTTKGQVACFWCYMSQQVQFQNRHGIVKWSCFTEDIIWNTESCITRLLWYAFFVLAKLFYVIIVISVTSQYTFKPSPILIINNYRNDTQQHTDTSTHNNILKHVHTQQHTQTRPYTTTHTNTSTYKQSYIQSTNHVLVPQKSPYDYFSA